MVFFQPISYGVVLLVFGLMSLGPGTQSLGLGHLSLGLGHLSLGVLTTSAMFHGQLSTDLTDVSGCRP